MRAWIGSLSPRTEFVLVVGVAFGWFVFVSAEAYLSGAASSHVSLSDADVAWIVGYEIAVLALLLPFLAVRGWSFDKVGLSVTSRDTFLGLALWLAFEAVWIAAAFVTVTSVVALEAVFPSIGLLSIGNEGAVLASAAAPGLVASLLLSIVNPFFEEVLVVGYVITTLRRRRSAWFAVNASTAIRLLYHLYQGPVAILSIVPLGLLFGAYYVRHGRLWPLVVAHGVLDLVALYEMGGW